MKQNRVFDITVGLFMLAGLLALFFLAVKVSGLSPMTNGEHYTLQAEFDNIGGLKPRAPVRMAGVKIGQVQSVRLDPETFKAIVTLWINKQTDKLPVDSSAKILTEGILGSNYIGIIPGAEDQVLHNQDRIESTYPALILENLIGQLLFSLKDKKTDDK